jgi:para-aminobenzoate synthetase / 4-amino-4-deoxychorismate lyase
MLPGTAIPSVLRAHGTVLLDASAGGGEEGRSLLFREPVREIVARTPAEVLPALQQMDAEVAAGNYVAGFIAYEAAAAWLPLKHVLPVDLTHYLWFGVYAAPEEVRLEPAASPSAPIENLRFDLDREVYRNSIERIRGHIREGDVYQINFTAPVRFRTGAPAEVLYLDVRSRQHVPFGAFLNAGGRHVLSFSPELFFRTRDRDITTRPMKGTVRRGVTPEEDRNLGAWLRNDAKSRAENLMIVDLLRNDLSIICEPGTVRVPALFEIEPYETVLQMTSTVTGRMRRGTTLSETFRALFPCGSVTGAPKLRAMEIIAGLEAAPRGPYCGAIGFAGPGEAAFNVAIRTVLLEGSDATMGVGSGVVWDSSADAEYDECLLKAAFLAGRLPMEPDFRLIETMRRSGGVVRLLNRHATRLRNSACHFGIAFDEDAFRSMAVRDAEGRGDDVVRITLAPDGRLDVKTHPLPPPFEGPAILWPEPVDSADERLLHKTNRRALYEAAWNRATEAGFSEAVFINECGEVTEGSRSTLFARVGERLVTPPVRCGLLPGVYRAHVLETDDRAEEGVLTPELLAAADEVFLCNAVRGMHRVEVVRDFHPKAVL